MLILSTMKTLLAIMLLLIWRSRATDNVTGLTDCLDVKSQVKPTTISDIRKGSPPQLVAFQSWQSKRPRVIDLTIVTMTTPSRIKSLEAQCESWLGPLSAVVYVGLVEDSASRGSGSSLSEENESSLECTAERLTSMYNRLEDVAGACQLDVTLVYEVLAEHRLAPLWPINAARNLAVLQAQTSLIAMVDVDFVISTSLGEDLTVPQRMFDLREDCRNKHIFILPAFQTTRLPDMAEAWHLAKEVTQSNKSRLGALMHDGVLTQFNPRNLRAHNLTNFSRWLDSTDHYEVKYTPHCEPWVIIDRQLGPLYDTRFRGYGWNKVSHVAHLAAEGFKFMVHGKGFIVHRQHPETPARRMYTRGVAQPASEYNLYHLMRSVLDDVQKGLKSHTYLPVTGAAVPSCQAVLPWWSKSGTPSDEQ